MKHFNFKSLIVLFLVLFGISPNALAWDIYGNLYFNKPSDWSNVTIFIGNDNGSVSMKFNRLDNTNLYYKWVDRKEYGDWYFADDTSDDQNWWSGYDCCRPWARASQHKYWGPYKDDYKDSKRWYFDGVNNTSKAGTLPLYSASLKVKLSENGGSTYIQNDSWPGKMKLKGTYMANDGQTGQSENECEVNSSYGDIPVTGEVTITYVSTTNAAYEFKGIGRGDTPSDNTSPKTYNITENTTYYAFFARKQFTITFGAGDNGSIGAKINSTSITSGSKQNYGSNITFTATPNSGYAVEGWYSDAEFQNKIDGVGTNTTYTINNITEGKTVYVKFKTQEYDVTFGVGTSYTSLGSVTASVNGGTAKTPGTYSIGASSKVVFTASPITGYHVAGWYSDAACSSAIAGAGTSYTITSLSKAETVYVKFAANTYSVKFNGNGSTSGSMSNQSFTYDEAVKALTTNAFKKTGYTFQGWDTNSAGTTVVYANEAEVSNLTTENNGIVNLYAVWQINTYNITYPASPAHYTITENTTSGDYNTSASFKATPAKGYLLTVTATKGSSPVSLNRNGDTYSFKIPDGDVSITVVANPYQLQGNFINHGGSFDDTKYNFDANFQYLITLNATTDYTFKLRNESATGYYLGNSGAITSTITEPWDFSTSVNNSCTIKTGVAGTYVFTYTEKNDGTPQILVTYPNVSKMNIDNVDYTLTQVGESNIYQTETFMLASKQTNYAFNLYWEGARLGNDNPMDDGQHGGKHGHTGWVYESTKRGTTNLYTTDVANGKYSFQFDASDKKLTAIYPSVIAGGFPNHSWDGEYTLNFDGNVGTINIVLDASETQIGFKVVDDGQFYGKQGVNIISTTTVTELTPSTESSYDMNLTPNIAGIYTFTYNRSDHSLTVTYPTSTQTYDVTVYADGITPTTVNVGSDPAEITAVEPQSMVFDKWVKEGETGNVTIANESSKTTSITATGAGASVRAIFKTQNTIYFKDNAKWGDVWLHFYSGEYWDTNKGSGSLNIQHSGMHATKIGKTDVWYFDKSSYSDWTSRIMAFTNQQASGHDKFYFVNCSYFDGIRGKSKFDDATPLFVVHNYITDYKNESQYYLEGVWMKYNSTESGFDLRGENTTDKTDKSIIWNPLESQKHKFTAPTPGEYTFSTTLHLLASQTYEMRIYDAAERWYSLNGDMMTSTSCTNWKLHLGHDGNFKVKTTSDGDYVFTISVGDGEMRLSITYPLSDNDYRVVYNNGSADKYNGYIIKNAGSEAKNDTASFFISGATGTVRLQKCTNAAQQTWVDVADQSIPLTNYSDGVYNFIVSQNGSSATLTAGGKYNGKFYIRTDGVDGGWESFKTNADNVMTDFGSELDAGVTYDNFQYDYYKTKWVHSGKNVKFRIANDYSKAISEDFAADAIINNKETLPQDANVRFMWNSKTNQLSRAYISGSTNIADRFLVLEGDAKMFDKDGNALHISGLNANEINFDDKNNWVYQADIKAQPGCAVKLTAAYNGTVQYFIGTSNESKTIIDGTSESKKQYSMRAVYDFKTNRLTAGWIPDGTQIDDELKLGGDLLLVREGQGDVQQITFGTNGKVTDIQHIYSVLTIKKDTMIGTTEKGYADRATNEDYAKTMYWVSFPFAVKVSEIFGVDGYGTKWIMQRYNGKKRAEIGWFTSQTSTFWEFIDESETLEAYKGYLFLINANYFNTSGADVWKNSATEANFYFPSTEDEIGIIKADTYDQPVPAHACGIDQEFTGKSGAMLNHKITDSYWNVIGVPAFQDAKASAALADGCTLKSYYKWKSDDNTYEVETVDISNVTFKTMHAYMVQFGGTLKWSNVSVVSNKAPYQYADNKNYRIELFFSNGEAEDHTYINLADEASTDFVLNEDMMKIDNSGQPNIYSFAGAYDVAYNETTFDNQSVMLGVSAPKDGSYTFAMPKDFSGKALLVDLESGEATDLNLSDYTVELNKGTYNNRFQLLLEVEAKAPTNMNPTKGEWSVDGKTKKLFINDNIYLINGGRIYNASGTMVR